MRSDISVILTLKNESDAHDLKNCIQSVCNQTLPVNEIIVVTDSSNKSIVKDIIDLLKDTCIRNVIKQEDDKNVLDKIFGARHARCKWLAFIDSDDLWVSNKIEKNLEELGKEGYKANNLIVSDAYLGHINDDVPGIIDTKIEHVYFDFTNKYKSYKAYYEYFPHIFSGLVVSKEHFMDSLETTVYDDWSLFLKLLKSANVIHMDRLYYIHKINLSKVDCYDADVLMARVVSLAKQRDVFSNIFGEAYYDSYLKRLYKKADEISLKEIKEKIVKLLGNTERLSYNNEPQCLIDFLNTHSSVVCYGSGDFGDKITRFIRKRKKEIKYVVVSDGREHPDRLNGFTVKDYSNVDFECIDGIVLAMDLRIYSDMKVNLKSKYDGDVFTITCDGVKALEKG